MRILLLTPSFYPALIYGGPSRSLHGLALALGQAGAEVRVLTSDANGRDQRLDVEHDRDLPIGPRVTVRYCRRRWLETGSAELLSCLPEAVSWADVVHLQAVYSFPTMPTLALARRLDKPLLWSPRGAFGRWEGSRRLGLKTIWRAACATIEPRQLTFHATSDHERDDILLALPRARIGVVPNGVALPAIPRAAHKRAAEAPLRLLFLGRLAPIKGIEVLLEAMTKLTGAGLPRVTLTVAGAGDDGYVRRLRRRAEDLKVAARVTFVGLLDDERRRQVFASADITVVPSHREAFSMVVAESLAHEVPVIASRGTPWPELAERGCGRWVKLDANSIATAIEELSSAPLDDMGERGRRWMAESFSWSGVAERMLGLYATAASGQRDAPK